MTQLTLPSKLLKGQLALITGGNKGIGLAIAHALAAQGARTILAGRDRAAGAQAATAIAAQRHEAHFHACDITSEDEVNALFEFCDSLGSLAIVINNAGIGTFKPLIDTSLKEWEQVLDVNLKGAFLCGREAMRRMQKGGGRIINIGSVVSLKGYPLQGAYSASKHGLLGLTKVMAAEGAEKDIIVQAICPGGVDTDLVKRARPDLDRSILMQPDDVADAVLFQLSQSGNAITDLVQLRRRGSAAFA
ncbi:MAG: SDR family NAD(P)-dependent oxidoreductase [Planctomycetota bacterium]|jgi:3-oxoacyl-[acyl-carrier protein] reductase